MGDLNDARNTHLIDDPRPLQVLIFQRRLDEAVRVEPAVAFGHNVIVRDGEQTVFLGQFDNEIDARRHRVAVVKALLRAAA